MARFARLVLFGGLAMMVFCLPELSPTLDHWLHDGLTIMVLSSTFALPPVRRVAGRGLVAVTADVREIVGGTLGLGRRAFRKFSRFVVLRRQGLGHSGSTAPTGPGDTNQTSPSPRSSVDS